MSNPIIPHDEPAPEMDGTPKRETITIERKMRDLGLTFEPATLREALKRQGKGGK